MQGHVKSTASPSSIINVTNIYMAKCFRLYAPPPFPTTNTLETLVGKAAAVNEEILFRRSDPWNVLSLPSCSDRQKTTPQLHDLEGLSVKMACIVRSLILQFKQIIRWCLFLEQNKIIL